MSTSSTFTVAMVTTWDEPGGIADYAHALVHELEKQVDIKIVALKRNTPQRAYYKALAEAANEADVVHVQHEYAFFGGLSLGQSQWWTFRSRLQKPLVITAHTWWQPFRGGPWWKKKARAIKDQIWAVLGWAAYLKWGQFRTAGAVIVHHPGFKTYLQTHGLNEKQVHYYPQGVELAPPVQKESALLTGPGWANKRLVVQYGFLMPSKGHLLAIEAMAGLPENVVLVIAGAAGNHPSELAYARQVAQRAKALGNRCVLMGYLQADQLHALIAQAELCLFPYTAGTSSYALSLAMSHRKACVTSNLDNFTAINRELPCLAVFKSGHAQALHQAMQELLSRPERRLQLQDAVGQWVERHHWGVLAQEHLGIYRQVLGKF